MASCVQPVWMGESARVGEVASSSSRRTSTCSFPTPTAVRPVRRKTPLPRRYVYHIAAAPPSSTYGKSSQHKNRFGSASLDAASA